MPFIENFTTADYCQFNYGHLNVAINLTVLFCTVCTILYYSVAYSVARSNRDNGAKFCRTIIENRGRKIPTHNRRIYPLW